MKWADAGQRPGAYARVVPSSVENGAEWAETLTDGTMQGLVALRLLLASGINQGSHQTLTRVAESALAQIDEELGDLKALVAEMRTTDLRQTSTSPRSSA